MLKKKVCVYVCVYVYVCMYDSFKMPRLFLHSSSYCTANGVRRFEFIEFHLFLNLTGHPATVRDAWVVEQKLLHFQIFKHSV